MAGLLLEIRQKRSQHIVRDVHHRQANTRRLRRDGGWTERDRERYSDDHHGFLRLEITSRLIIGRYYAVPRPQEPYSKGSQLIDYFEFDWTKKRYVPNTL